MIYKGKDASITFNGERLKGFITKSVTLFEGPIESSEEFPCFDVSDITIDMQLMLGPKANWFLKNELFIKNRPPRGMQ